MADLNGGLRATLHFDREVTYGEVEDALKSAGFLTGYLILREPASDGTSVTISVHVPVDAITADGVPKFDAVSVLRSIADAIETVDAAKEPVD